MDKNYVGARKTIEEQKKRPMNIERQVEIQKFNSFNHPSVNINANYLGAMKTFEEQINHPLDLQMALKQLKENSKDHPAPKPPKSVL